MRNICKYNDKMFWGKLLHGDVSYNIIRSLSDCKIIASKYGIRYTRYTAQKGKISNDLTVFLCI